jgi:CheY-like chemotaxis protein
MSGSASVLVVDGDRDNRELLVEYLVFEGFEVAAAGDGLDALNRAVELRPDLVLTELRLPGVDGFELTRSLRAHPRLRDTLTVAVTATDHTDDRVRAMRAGCTAVIAKPYDLRALVSLIKDWLSARTTSRSNPTQAE